MISNYRVLAWFAIQLSVAAGGAVGAMTTVTSGFIVAAVSLIANLSTLWWGWSVRHRKNALKAYSDCLAMIGLAGFLVLLFSRELILALGLLLFFAQLAMNLVMREYRQLYFGLVIAFCYVMSGAAEAVSGTYLLVFVLYGLSVSFCLGEAWLDRTSGVVKELARPPVWQRLKVTGLLLGLTLFIYLVMPRPPAMLLGGQQSSAPDYYTDKQWEREAENPTEDTTEDTAETNLSEELRVKPEKTRHTAHDRHGSARDDRYNYSGFEEQFDIQQANEGRTQGNGIVAYMRAPHGAYLKMRTFDRFDGTRWFSSTTDYRKQKVPFDGAVLADGRQGNFRQVIHIEQTLPPWLPAASLPVKLWVPSTVIGLDAWLHPLLPDALRAGTRYTVSSSVDWMAGRPLGGEVPPAENDLRIPENTDPRIRQLALEITRQAEDPMDRAVALENHLRTRYDYSFDSIFESQGVTPLSKFLFEDKRGHCEYFASAMAIMLRTLDIPARLITGFSATRKNPLTGFYEIRALDGHAWVEAWIEGVGWVTFEPTAFYELPVQREEIISARQINEYVESLQREADAVDNTKFSFTGLLMSLWQTLYTAALVILSYAKLLFLYIWPYLAGLLLTGAVLVATRDRWLPVVTTSISGWRIRRYRPRDVQASLHFYLHHLQRVAGCRGVNRMPGEHLEKWVEKLDDQFDVGTEFEELVVLVNKGFYEEQPVSSRSIRRAALAALRALKSN